MRTGQVQSSVAERGESEGRRCGWSGERKGRGGGGVAGRVWNNKTATDCGPGPDRPHRGGALIQGAMRAADMT